MDLKEKCASAIYASIIGDALAVPSDSDLSSPQQQTTLCSVKNLFGYGRYDQPKGTWSDDTSLILCTMDSLSRGYDLEDIGKTFCSWLYNGLWTASGFVFDSGITTVSALESIQSDQKSAYESGCDTEDDNGNGSLIRILPAALYFSSEDTDTFLQRIHEISGITHAHPRSQLGCGILSLFLRNLLGNKDKVTTFKATISEALKYYQTKKRFKDELVNYDRLLSSTFIDLEEDEIYTSGYIIHTLETAIWCFLHFNTSREILISAVELGLVTDTNGSVAGGLAGICYGIQDLPTCWFDSLAKKEAIDKLIAQFSEIIKKRLSKET